MVVEWEQNGNKKLRVKPDSASRVPLLSHQKFRLEFWWYPTLDNCTTSDVGIRTLDSNLFADWAISEVSPVEDRILESKTI